MLEVGKLYKVFGEKVVKVYKIDEDYIHTMWPNGTFPSRQADRLFPITWEKHFVEVTK